MGVFKVEQRSCGCKVKTYAGGLIAISGCNLHESRIRYLCPVCYKEFESKRQLRKHRWDHAI